MEAGNDGVTVADLHKERWEQRSAPLIDEVALYRGGTYQSFARYFHWFKQLGFVESIRTEPSEAKGDGIELESPRHYYRISDKGRRAPIEKWQDPIFTLLELKPYDRCKPYRKPTGRPRGRPSKLWERE